MTAVLDERSERSDVDESARAVVDPGRLWQAARLPVAIAVVVIVVGTVLALLRGGVRGGLLDPEAARPPGGQALAVLLRQRDVDVRRAPAPTAAPDVTTFVPVPALLADDVDVDLLVPSRDRDVVVVAPGEELLSRLRAAAPGLGVAVTGGAEPEDRRPRCALRAARAAGVARTGGEAYSVDDGVECYPGGGGAAVVSVPHDGGRLVVVGAPDLFTNDALDEEGNAALALGLLSERSRLDWVYPRSGERAVSDERRSLVELLPDTVVLAAIQLVLAAVWLALWRARRLGPVVPEALPAVVRAAEAVEGRASLYRSARAHDRAAESLRAASRRRLALVLGLGVAPSREAVVAAVASRSGRDAARVDEVLYGRRAIDDASLVQLARDLDRLDSEVRSL